MLEQEYEIFSLLLFLFFTEEYDKEDNETFEKEEIIEYLENTELISCVVIDFVENAIKEVDGNLSRLGMCNSYFQFDNKYLHNSQNKQLKDFTLQICLRAFNVTKPQYIYCLCYEDMDRHIYYRPGKEKKVTTCITKNFHKDDITKGLELLGN
ncbi:hypothetical protein Glove_519g43 [Diversispora epigaea]|uniref:Uncharacterized protein n=1 Tax=Diversispora epigaea TaxID=1348612 RepID=A0A397GIJ5_9GLOM|nr:hypothetical protein Glove_519g43 [Diversispora epigaea]